MSTAGTFNLKMSKLKVFTLMSKLKTFKLKISKLNASNISRLNPFMTEAVII